MNACVWRFEMKAKIILGEVEVKISDTWIIKVFGFLNFISKSPLE